MLKIIQNNPHRITIFLLFLLQIGFISCYLPLSEWFNENPIYTDDYSIHYADTLYKKIYLNEYKVPFGYTPYTNAGTVSNALMGVDSHGWGLFVYLTSFLPSGFSFKLYFLISLLSIPFIMYGSARNFELSIKQSLICTTIGTTFQHISIIVDFLYWGMISYVVSCYICLFITSVFYKYLKYEQNFDIACFTLLFTVGSWIHLFTMLHLLVPCTVCYLFYLRRLSVKAHILIISAIILIFIFNAPWLIPFLNLLDATVLKREHFLFSTSSLLEPLKNYLFLKMKFNEYMNIPFLKSSIVDVMLLGLGVLGIVQWKKEKQTLNVCLFSITICFLFILSYYGAFWSFTSNLTPLRFVIFMNLFLTIPASVGIIKLYNLFFIDKSFKIKCVSLSVVLYLTGMLLSNPYYHLFVKKDFRLITKIPVPIQELTHWIVENTSSDGRILIEHSDFETGHQYYGTHLPYLFPLITNREYIGNYLYYTMTLDAFTSFSSSYLFQRPVTEYTPEAVWSYISLYNIKWIIVWSDPSRTLFESAPHHFTFKKRIDKFFIFEANRLQTFFIKGSGKIKAELNKIEMSDLHPHDGEIIIAYHWIKHLRTSPETTINQTFFLKDPVGFITLKSPPPNVIIYNSYEKYFLDF